ncbi:MAG: hypothetical protein HYX72_11860 [Acidobacteria bacterium]|nr:hypothetical protein [Acidobacteriota bacterium]
MSSIPNDIHFEKVAAIAAARAHAHAAAESRMRRGKRLVITGFVIAIVGVIGYCVACLSAGVNQNLGTTFLENPALLVGPTLGFIGVGTLIWLVGSVLFLMGSMDDDPEREIY